MPKIKLILFFGSVKFYILKIGTIDFGAADFLRFSKAIAAVCTRATDETHLRF